MYLQTHGKISDRKYNLFIQIWLKIYFINLQFYKTKVQITLIYFQS